MTMKHSAIAYDFSNLPKFEGALDSFFYKYQQLYGDLDKNIGKRELFDQMLANGNDIFQFSRRIEVDPILRTG